MKAVFAIMKRMMGSNRISFIITAIVVLAATTPGDSAAALSKGNYTWLLAAMTPFFFVFYDCKKLMLLGMSKKDYFAASLISYGLLAVFISLANTMIYLFIDSLNRTQTVVNMMNLSGWTDNGIFVALIQQAVFLLLAMIFLHVALSMQNHWYGWITDIVLVTIISVFTAVKPLRHILPGFFKITMFNSNAPLHIAVCLGLSAALSWLGLIVLKRETL